MPSRHIGIDALFFEPGRSGGSETYLRELVPRLARLSPEIRFSVMCGPRGAQALRDDGWGDFVTLEELPANDDERVRKLVAQQMLLPALARRRRFDLVHSLANLSPVRIGCPLVVTVLDVIYMTHDTMSRLSRAFISGIVRRAAPRAAAIVTISEAARGEILRVLPAVDPDRVIVVPLGGGREAVEPAPEAAVRARVALPADSRMILCVGALRRHKNQALLAPALRLLPDDVHVVCAGSDGEDGDVVRAAAQQAGVSARFHVPGYLSDAEVESLWAVADAFVLPTRAEGFGLPVLEAMSRRVPVACSDLPVLREVAGDCAAFFDPDDPAAAAQAIERALEDRGLTSGGTRRAAAFSWDRTAQETLDVYGRVLASR